MRCISLDLEVELHLGVGPEQKQWWALKRVEVRGEDWIQRMTAKYSCTGVREFFSVEIKGKEGCAKGVCCSGDALGDTNNVF